MNVDDFAQGETGRMVFAFRFGQAFTDLIPVGFGGGEAVVAVTHGQQQRMFAFRIHQGVQAPVHLRQLFGAVDSPAGQVAAVHHQVKIINLPQGSFVRLQRLQHRTVRIVDQDHDMGQFHRRAPADFQPRGKPVGDRLLGRADQRQGTFFKGILLQVHGADQTQAGSGGDGPFAQDKTGIHSGSQQALGQVVRHGAVDLWDQGFTVLQVVFRQDQPDGGRRVPGNGKSLFPVFRFRSVLVAGDAGPGFRFDAGGRKQDLCGTDSDSFKGHGLLPFRSECYQTVRIIL